MTSPRDLSSALADRLITPHEAADLIAHLGFELVHGDRPDGPGGANLLVALRAKPTLVHFDPETISYWTFTDGHGRLEQLDRATHLPLERAFSWGQIRIVDRLGVSNVFLGFGGALHAEAVNANTTVAVFATPAPIFRAGGHSQESDLRALEVGAFFARVKIPIDFQAGVESSVGQVTPLALYATAIGDLRARLGASEALRETRPEVNQWSRREALRLQATAPEEWRAGAALLHKLGLST